MSSILMFSFAFSQDTETEEVSPEQIMQQKIDDLSNDINEMKSIFNQENATLQSKIMMLEKANKDLAKELGDNLENQKSQFETSWNNGYSISSGDGMHSLKFGGRLMLDESRWTIDDNSALKGLEIRRARLYHAGHVYGNIINYKFDFDLSNASISFKDMYVELNMQGAKKSWGKIRAGHFKQPFGLESLTSSNYMTFMERSLPNSLNSTRGAGTMYHTSCFSDKLSMQFGYFLEGKNNHMNFATSDAHNINGRLTYLPINKDDKLLHIGTSFVRRANLTQTVEDDHVNNLMINENPENHFTGNMLNYVGRADAMNSFGTEMSLVLGSLSFQAEYMMSSIGEIHHHDEDHDEDHGDHEDVGMSGYYAQVSYFLTGEKREYKSSYSGFGRVSPKKNYLDNKGFGALELAIRYSGMNFDETFNMENDMFVPEGSASLNNFTVGLNWYINPAMRFMFNYVMSTKKSDADGMEDVKENALMSRIQINF